MSGVLLHITLSHAKFQDGIEFSECAQNCGHYRRDSRRTDSSPLAIPTKGTSELPTLDRFRSTVTGLPHCFPRGNVILTVPKDIVIVSSVSSGSMRASVTVSFCRFGPNSSRRMQGADTVMRSTGVSSTADSSKKTAPRVRPSALSAAWRCGVLLRIRGSGASVRPAKSTR